MKIAGVEIKDRPEDILVLPRGEDRIVFRGRPVEDFAEFDALCPVPVPPKKLTKDGASDDTDNFDYRHEMDIYGQRRVAWIVIKTLEASGIEWDTVDMNKPGTWLNFEKDLKAAHFTAIEINRLTAFVLDCNALNEAKLEKARQDFFHGAAARNA